MKHIPKITVILMLLGIVCGWVGAQKRANHYADNIVQLKDSIEYWQEIFIAACSSMEGYIYNGFNGTVYSAVEEQTDNTPLITSSGDSIYTDLEQRYIAVSQEALAQGIFDYGDTILILSGNFYGAELPLYYKGFWVVKDCHPGAFNLLDFLVPVGTMPDIFTNICFIKLNHKEK